MYIYIYICILMSLAPPFQRGVKAAAKALRASADAARSICYLCVCVCVRARARACVY